MLNEIFTTAREDQRKLPHQIMAHQISAEYHRHKNKVLGGCSTVLTTLIGTAVFTGLVSQFGLGGNSDHAVNPFQVTGGIWLYGVVLFLSVLAPTIAALSSFMHDAEEAASHQVSVAGLSRVLSRLTVFLAKYGPDTPSEKTNEILNAYDDIMKEYDSVLARSLPLAKRSYKKAGDLMRMIEVPESSKS